MNGTWCKAGIFATFGLLFVGEVAAAETYPTKPIRIIVPFSAGGTTDMLARLLSPLFHDWTGRPFVVENRAGASGLIGAEIAARSRPDGYTILFSTATLTINRTLYGSRMKIDPVTDLAPISWVASTPLVLVVHPSVPAKSVQELIELAKRKRGFLTAGFVPGSTSHLSAEMLKQKAGIEPVEVPYKGGGPAVVALMSGEIDYLIVPGPAAWGAYRSGRVRALAVTAAKSASAFPGVPNMNTLYPGFEADNWYAMWFPTNTPGDIVAKINGFIAKALQDGKVRQLVLKQGLDPVGSTPEELGEQVKREIDKYAEVIRRGKIRLE